MVTAPVCVMSTPAFNVKLPFKIVAPVIVVAPVPAKVAEPPTFVVKVEEKPYAAELLKVMHPSELNQIRLNKETRRLLLTAFQQYFGLHVQDFGQMKTLKIMQDVLG